MKTEQGSLRVIQAGPLSLLVDEGRLGYNQLGITQGGPMDREAFNQANQLLGNPQNTCAIEVTLGGLLVICEEPTQITLTGLDVFLSVNGKRKLAGKVLTLNKGDTAEVIQGDVGVRSYFAIKGGFEAPLQFGSATTVVREGLGGLKKNGEPIKNGDVLTFSTQASIKAAVSEPVELNMLEHPTKLRLIPGYQFGDFTKAAVNRFFSTEFFLSSNMDRMGARLCGPSIESPYANMLSEGISFGAVQIPTDGQPIIMLNDRQTIGGYPKLGSIFSPDCDRLAQCRPGSKVRFEQISIFEAHNMLHLRQYTRK